MTIILDRITLNDDCFQTSTPPPPPPRRRHHRRDPQPLPTSPSQCTGTFNFHVREENGGITPIPQPIPFERSGTALQTSQSRLNNLTAAHITHYDIDTYLQNPQVRIAFTLAPTVFTSVRQQITALSGSSGDLYVSVDGSLPPIQIYANDLFNFLMLGETTSSTDVTQLDNFNRLLGRLYNTSLEPRSNLWAMTAALIAFNSNNFSSYPPLLARANMLMDIFFIYKNFKLALPESLSPTLQSRAESFFNQWVGYLYFENPPLQNILTSMRELALSLYQIPPSGNPPQRINLYNIVKNILTEPIIRLAEMGQEGTTSPQTLRTRAPFNIPNHPAQTRLENMRRFVNRENIPNVLRYSLLENPRQALLEGELRHYSQVNTLNTLRINAGFNNAVPNVVSIGPSWFTDNNNARLSEVLRVLLFDPTHPAASNDTALLEQSADSLPRLNVRVARLRNNYAALLAAHPREQSQYRAAALLLMHSIFGNGVPQNEIGIPTPEGELRLPLQVDDRSNLVRFYEELSGNLGASSNAQVAQSTVQWVSLGLCLLGGGARVIYNFAGNNWDGGPDGLLAAAGAFCGYSGGTFIADLVAGSRTSNRVLRNNVAGTIGAIVLGVSAGTLPMLAPGHSPPPPMGRPIDGRNPVSEWGP